MWSTHSRRFDPISRSTTPFCQGEASAVGLSRIPARNRRVTTLPIDPERHAWDCAVASTASVAALAPVDSPAVASADVASPDD
jgi:hypothetical protein